MNCQSSPWRRSGAPSMSYRDTRMEVLPRSDGQTPTSTRPRERCFQKVSVPGSCQTNSEQASGLAEKLSGNTGCRWKQSKQKPRRCCGGDAVRIESPGIVAKRSSNRSGSETRNPSIFCRTTLSFPREIRPCWARPRNQLSKGASLYLHPKFFSSPVSKKKAAPCM